MISTESVVALRTIEEIETAPRSDEVVRTLTRFASAYGFTTVTLAQLVNPALVNANRIAITNWPTEYLQRRLRENLIIRDPIVRYALRTKQPFTWQTAYDHADKLGRRVLDEARDYTQREGIMFPVYAFDEIPGGVSLGTDQLSVTTDQIRLIDLVCQHAYMRVAKLLGPFPYSLRAKLSNREVEVLHFAAAGKSNWEIGTILGLSEHTVHEYMKSAASKLNTSGRTHTVAMAIAQQQVLY